MITILRSTEFGLERSSSLADGSWINLVNPDHAEIASLAGEYCIPQDFLAYPLDLDERARTEKEDEALLVILRVPHFVGDAADSPYTTVPLGIILTPRVILTICRVEAGVIRDMMAGRFRGLSTTKRNRFVLHLFYAAADTYLRYLREINRATEALEDKLQLATRNSELYGLLKYQKSLTYFTTALKSNQLMIARLQKSRLFLMYEEDEDLLEDVLTEFEQAIEMVNISTSILTSMLDAFGSIIGNNLNGVMKLLASVTIATSIPTIIFGFFGMNVDLPFDHLPVAYLITILISVFAMGLTMAVFAKKDWL